MTSQPIVAPPAAAAIFLVATVRPGGEQAVRDLLADVAGITRAVGFHAPRDELTCVAGIGAGLWDRLYDRPRPPGLHPFVEMRGARHVAVSTPGDLLFHIRSRRADLCFELARRLLDPIDGAVDVVDEVHGFRYFDERDLLGFVDGTENPDGPAADAAVFIGAEDPDHAGGSYAIVQKYLHDLGTWNALPVEEQERAFGRHKLSDIEFADDDKPADAHIVLNTITDPDGTERKILRANMAFGSVSAGEFGTYYIGYAADPDVIERMLRNMFVGDPPGTHDRILDFSTAVTGTLFYIPTADFLEDPDAGRAAASAPGDGDEPVEPDVAPDAGLGIGSLNRRTP